MWGTSAPDRPRWSERVAAAGLASGDVRQAAAVESLGALLARIDRRYLSLLGGALALVTLVPLSLVTSSGIDGYKAFVFNTASTRRRRSPTTWACAPS